MHVFVTGACGYKGSVLTPKLTLAWLGVLVAAALIHLLWFRREYRRAAIGS